MPVAHDLRPPTAWIPNADEQADLDAIDVAVARMRRVTAPDPYVLTIPQDVDTRYRHSNRLHAEAYCTHTPFFRSEHESLQYQTFVFHEHGRDIFVLQPSRSEEHPSSDAVTPTAAPVGPPKKKISLHAYTKKQHGADRHAAPTAQAPAKQGAVKGPAERVRSEADEILAAVADSDCELPTESSERLNERKRKRQDLQHEEKEEEQVKKRREKQSNSRHDRGVEDDAFADRAASSSRKAVTAEGEDTSLTTQKSSSAAPHRTRADGRDVTMPGLPPRLSPGMPEKLSPLQRPQDSKIGELDTLGLPPRLSPTLPNNILRALDARPRSSDPAAKATDVQLTPPRRPDAHVKHKSPVPRNGFRANSSSPAVSVSRVRSPERALQAVQNPHRPQARGRKGLILVLKVKRARREDLQRILKMRPRPDRKMALAEQVERSRVDEGDPPVKGVAQKLAPIAKEKKAPPPKQEDDIPPSSPPRKRRKGADLADVRAPPPSTPARRGRDSPSTKSSAPLASTPGSARKDLFSAAMKRDLSHDSTATQNHPHYNTPPARSALPIPGTKPPRQHAYELEQRRLELLGRELKHAASALLPTSTSAASGSSPKPASAAAAATSLESLICYLFAFTCADCAALSALPRQTPQFQTWHSLTGLYGFVKRTTEPFPPLAGIAASCAVAFIARTLDLAARFPADNSAALTRDALLAAQTRLFRAAREAETRASSDELARTFPRSWHARARDLKPAPSDSAAADADHDNDRSPIATDGDVRLAGPYPLPLGLASSPLRAARAAHALLKEWAERQDGYTLRLEL